MALRDFVVKGLLFSVVGAIVTGGIAFWVGAGFVFAADRQALWDKLVSTNVVDDPDGLLDPRHGVGSPATAQKLLARRRQVTPAGEPAALNLEHPRRRLLAGARALEAHPLGGEHFHQGGDQVPVAGKHHVLARQAVHETMRRAQRFALGELGIGSTVKPSRSASGRTVSTHRTAGLDSTR